MEEALTLYRGDFLEGTAGGDWATLRQDELRQRYVEALLTLGGWYFTQEHYARAVALFYRAITCDTYHEGAHRALMHAYARLGQRTQALRATRHWKSVCVMNWEGEPGHETRALFDLLRQGEAV